MKKFKLKKNISDQVKDFTCGPISSSIWVRIHITIEVSFINSVRNNLIDDLNRLILSVINDDIYEKLKKKE